MENPLFDYYRNRQAPLQWRGALGALAQSLTNHFSPEQLRTLLREAGQHFASQHPVQAAETVQSMQDAMNGVWTTQDWGWVDIHDLDSFLTLTHYAAPLESAFGAQNLAWSAAFLEGVYEQWFRQLGASDALHVRQSEESDVRKAIVLRLGR
ncbi:cellulose biosynthesis protein BcsD [Orrella dioscoreae]|uniref:Cellulose synthase operon protein D n=1 Tax=Orrella dioscoreae TaxID=1851544 RepID=A0A1C3K6W2_9BURK|nr:cellulose biosynthesis protein BcsD [Orrella dioscoreae]SBT27233.1 conserved hypothetical protein [Orrella dioscoreae]SOE50259.1 conserved hypothetical protein [Orrella dioscoreae]